MEAKFLPGQRVEANPACDCWMMGDRYGDVKAVGRKWVFVWMDRSQTLRRFHPSNLVAVY